MHSSTEQSGFARMEFAAVAVVAIAGALGLALAWQGWRWRIPDAQDWISDIASARALVFHGRIPDRGTVTSYLSYAPPGTAWLFAPGVALFQDPRLIFIPATGFLYTGALVGIFLLALRTLGLRIATLAAVAYALSMPALAVASAPSPRGPTAFYLATIYCLYLWLNRRDGRYFAAALLALALGMFIFLELAPAIFAVFAIWLIWRPPVRLRPLAYAALLTLIIWYPYLRFEIGRGFMDIRSQIERRVPAQPWGDREVWCDPKLMPVPMTGGEDAKANLGEMFTTRLATVGGGLVGSFQGAVPGTNLILLLMTLAGLWLCLGPWLSTPPFRASTSLSLLFAILLAMLVVLRLYESSHSTSLLGRAVRDHLPWLLSGLPQTLLLGLLGTAVAGAVFLMHGRIGVTLRGFAVRFHPPGDPRPLALALLVPWIILLLLLEPYRFDRVFWLVPLQMIVLATAVVSATERSKVWRWAGPVAMICLVAANPLLLSRVQDWGRSGWSGREAPEAQTADYLAQTIQSMGKNSVRIGYPMPLLGGRPPFDVALADGASIDLLLNRRGVVNSDQCAEGESADDEFRVVDKSMPGPYLEMPVTGRLSLVRQFGRLDVYRRE